jgi:hypothetical protein
MARKSSLLKYNRINTDIPMDGCGDCAHCIAEKQCSGCNMCPASKCPKTGCQNCTVKCWSSTHLQNWLTDINTVSLETHKCHITFDEHLPTYIPQVQNNAFGYNHPAYIVNIHRLICHKTRRWNYREKGLKHHFNIPQSSKTIISFCTADELLEPIWTHSNNWQDGKSFWKV